MLRSKSIQKYEMEVRASFQEVINLCRHNMLHVGELLLCQQNGFIDYGGNPCVGLGIEGINCMQQINFISSAGIGEITDDDNYFAKHGNSFFKGISELQSQIHCQKTTYLNIWENAYFLRVFTQVINLLNRSNYDWHLDISKLPLNGQSKHIREQIV